MLIFKTKKKLQFTSVGNFVQGFNRRVLRGVIAVVVLWFLVGGVVWGQSSGEVVGGGTSGVVGVGASGVGGEPNELVAGELTDELWDLVGQLRQVRADYYQARQGRIKKIEEMGENVRKLESELAELRRRDGELDENLLVVRTDIDELKQQKRKTEAANEVLQGKLGDLVERISVDIERGIPCRQEERLGRLAAMRLGPGSRSVSESDAELNFSEQLGMFWSFFQEEMRLAGGGETYTDEIFLGPERKSHVRLFRLGHQVMGYLTEDGGQSGLWQAGPVGQDGGQWRHNLSGAEDENVRLAIEILDRRQVPQRVSLPVRLLSEPTERAEGGGVE